MFNITVEITNDELIVDTTLDTSNEARDLTTFMLVQLYDMLEIDEENTVDEAKFANTSININFEMTEDEAGFTVSEDVSEWDEEKQTMLLLAIESLFAKFAQ